MCYSQDLRGLMEEHIGRTDNDYIYLYFQQTIGVTVSRERLRAQLDSNRLSLERTKSIANYLTKISKYNCDHKKLIAIIRNSCDGAEFNRLSFKVSHIPLMASPVHSRPTLPTSTEICSNFLHLLVLYSFSHLDPWWHWLVQITSGSPFWNRIAFFK